jgi:putative membrane protein
MEKLIKLFCISGLIFLYSCEQPGRQDTTDRAEEINEERFEDRDELQDASEFAVEASAVNMMEIELGNLAAERATSQEVRNFAQKIVNDHNQAQERLRAIAQRKNIALPEDLPQDRRDKIEDFREKSGNEFDKDYMDFIVDKHQDEINDYEDAADNLDDNEIKQYANETLPNLREHREEAERIQERLRDAS